MYDDYADVGEATALASAGPQPTYTFESSALRVRRRQVRKFQCCACVVFLSVVAVAVVMSVAFNLRHLPSDDSTSVNDSAADSLFVLMAAVPLVDESPRRESDASDAIDAQQYEGAVAAGRAALRERDVVEQRTPEPERDSASYKHQRIVYTSRKARHLGRVGYAEENAARHLARIASGKSRTICYNSSVVADALAGEHVGLPDVCSAALTSACDDRYRSFDGTCNNLKHPRFGVAHTSFRRVLRPAYADGVSAPRAAADGSALPSARLVSLTVHRPVYRDDPAFTVMLAVFGQFLDHDITATALSRGANGKAIACCAPADAPPHPECYPVALDAADPLFRMRNVSCMEFVRSQPSATCCFGARQQLNQATAYIDGSVVYGDWAASRRLRSFANGALRMLAAPDGRELLPPSEDLDDGCNRAEEAARGRYCFATGDGRANENLHLTSMHLLWARQHNLLAARLRRLNPHWGDERLFLEGRKLLAAQLAHIAYSEFLPILFGAELMAHFDLRPLAGAAHYRGYDDALDATAANVFAAAAFRFAHTLIPSLVRMHADGGAEQLVELRRMLLDPFRLYDNATMDAALRGAASASIAANDPFFSDELKQHLFERPVPAADAAGNQPCGLDLVSLNIQRGRDHGLPGYASWRARCGLRRPRSFQQLDADVGAESLARIGSVYKHVDDIDLYTGAISERPIRGGFLGPTLTCLLLDQFVRLKRGDRFWYENPGQFSGPQLRELRKTSLARIICDNSDGVAEIQPAVMRRAGATHRTNRRVPCDAIAAVDLRPWREVRVPLRPEGVRVVTMRNVPSAANP